MKVILKRGPKDPIEYVEKDRKSALRRALALVDLHNFCPYRETKSAFIVDASKWYTPRKQRDA